MKYTNIISIVIISFFATACQKHEVPHPTPPAEKTLKLSAVEKENYLSTNFEYNDQEQLSKITHTSYGMSQTTEFFRNNAGKIHAQKSSDYRTKYYYALDQLTRIDVINIHQDPNNTEPEAFLIASYEGKKLTRLLHQAIREGDTITYDKTLYAYYANGDLKDYQFWYYRQDEKRWDLEIAEHFEYDQKKSPWLPEVLTNPWLYNPYNELNDFLPAAHNVTRQTSYYESTVPVCIRTTSYLYSATGYPMSAVVHWEFTDPRDEDISEHIRYTYLR